MTDRHSKTLAAAAIVVATCVMGCVERTLMVQSDPPGALVSLNGHEIGRTPMTADFTFYGKYDVVLRKEGYETLQATSKVNPPLYDIPPFDLIAEMLPMRLRSRHELSYTMRPAAEAAVDSAALIDRAEAMQGTLESSRQPPAATTQPAK